MELRTDLLIDMSSDLDDRKCKSIYCNRKRSRKKSSNTMSKQFKHNISFSLSILLFIIILIASKSANGQFPKLANAIWGKDSYLPGIKKIVGGVLAADITHSKCGQKMLCDEMAPAKVEMTEAIDPVKRTIVRIPRLVKPQGRLRWIGDALVNTVSRVSRRLGINPEDIGNSNRRQGVQSSFVAKGLSGMMGVAKSIPVDMVMHTMDFVADATNFFDRRGAIYPYARAATIGYMKGGDTATSRGDDDYTGVCNQISEDKCAMERVSDDGGHRWTGWWSHLPTANEYEAGHLSRTNSNSELAKSSLSRAGLERDSLVENQWNFMRPADILKPRIFICKAGRFLDTMSYQMGGEGSIKGKDENHHVSENFEDTCDPAHLEEKPAPKEESLEEGNQVQEDIVQSNPAPIEANNNGIIGGDDIDHTVAVLDVRNKSVDAGFKLPPTSDFKLPPENRVFHDLPILVMEGLEKPKIDQTEEDLVSEVLADMVSGLPRNSVRTAIRLPMKQQTSGKSIVLVELDTDDHEELILKQRNALRGSALNRKNNSIQDKSTKVAQEKQNQISRNDKFLLQRWKNLGIRRAKFKELWKFVEELAVVKRVEKDDLISDNKIENNKFQPSVSDNKIQNNKFLFGTEAETSLNILGSNNIKKKNNENASKPVPIPPQITVRKKTPIEVQEGSGNQA